MRSKQAVPAKAKAAPHNDWVSVADQLPRRRQHYRYGTRYSRGVLAVVNGEVWWAILAWDYDNAGWVQADLSEGPSPDDYEDAVNVSHWRYLPEPPATA